jgi:hypothetical protein
MKFTTMKSTSALIAMLSVSSVSAFGQPKHHHQRLAFTSTTTSSLHMGLFDGAKEAFDSPQAGTKASDRETPIDRWFGWSTESDEERKKEAAKNGSYGVPSNFVDSMDPANYVAVELQKPMGIVFEENEEQYAGIYVTELQEGGFAANKGILEKGDQLVAVGDKKVTGLIFEDALDTIVASPEETTTKLLLFRGSAKQLYGPTGASQDWLDEFIGAGGVVPN